MGPNVNKIVNDLIKGLVNLLPSGRIIQGLHEHVFAKVGGVLVTQ